MNRNGQTLVEVVVIIGVVVLLVTGLVAGTTTSLKSAQSGRVRSQAVSLATEALERVRSVRDQSWSALVGYAGLYCLGSDGVFTPSAGTCSVNITDGENTFTRSVRFTWQDPKMVVTAVVVFIEGDSEKDVTLETYLTQWK